MWHLLFKNFSRVLSLSAQGLAGKGKTKNKEKSFSMMRKFSFTRLILLSISYSECIHTWIFHYKKIFHIIPTLLRLHKSMKLRFSFLCLLSSASCFIPPKYIFFVCIKKEIFYGSKNTSADEKFKFPFFSLSLSFSSRLA